MKSRVYYTLPSTIILAAYHWTALCTGFTLPVRKLTITANECEGYCPGRLPVVSIGSKHLVLRSMLCRDQCPEPRTVMSMTWHPDECKKLAAAYSSCVFQQLSPCNHSYVWDIGITCRLSVADPKLILQGQGHSVKWYGPRETMEVDMF